MVQEKLVSSEKTKKDERILRNEPQLRFREFLEPFKEVLLGDISSNGMYGMNCAAKEFDGENKYIRITDIDENSHNFVPNPLSSPNGVLEDKFLLKENDIVFARTGASTGKSYLYDKNDGKLYFAGFLIKLEITNAYAPFVYYNTLRENYNNWVCIMSVRSGQPGINLEEYKKFKINLPSFEEQKKIASFLSAIDKKIELLEKKLVLYQKIVNFNIFKIYADINDYNEIKLKDIVRPYTSNLSINKLEENHGNYPLYGAEGIIKHVDFYELENPYISIIKDGAGVGRLDLCKEFSSALGTLQCLIPKKDIDINFLYFYLKTLKFRKYIVGSTIPHIYFKDYSNERIKVPSLKDQQNIGNYFTLLEKRNDIIQKKIKIFNTFKQGLLRKMFV